MPSLSRPPPARTPSWFLLLQPSPGPTGKHEAPPPSALSMRRSRTEQHSSWLGSAGTFPPLHLWQALLPSPQPTRADRNLIASLTRNRAWDRMGCKATSNPAPRSTELILHPLCAQPGSAASPLPGVPTSRGRVWGSSPPRVPVLRSSGLSHSRLLSRFAMPPPVAAVRLTRCPDGLCQHSHWQPAHFGSVAFGQFAARPPSWKYHVQQSTSPLFSCFEGVEVKAICFRISGLFPNLWNKTLLHPVPGRVLQRTERLSWRARLRDVPASCALCQSRGLSCCWSRGVGSPCGTPTAPHLCLCWDGLCRRTAVLLDTLFTPIYLMPLVSGHQRAAVGQMWGRAVLPFPGCSSAVVLGPCPDSPGLGLLAASPALGTQQHGSAARLCSSKGIQCAEKHHPVSAQARDEGFRVPDGSRFSAGTPRCSLHRERWSEVTDCCPQPRCHCCAGCATAIGSRGAEGSAVGRDRQGEERGGLQQVAWG